MMFRSTAIVTVLMFAAATTGCAGAAERDFPVTGFDRLQVRGPTDVTVRTGSAPGVHASGDSAALDRLDIRVEGGTLVIATKGGGWSWKSDATRVSVTVPSLRGIALSGSGDVTVDRIEVPEFVVGVSGSGDVQLPRLETARASFTVSGSGDVMAAGTAREVGVNVSGSGDVDVSALKSEALNVAIRGSGDVNAHASRTATVSVAGSGDVNVKGGARCTIAKSGSGDVNCS